jgi:hypothetical protein
VAGLDILGPAVTRRKTGQIRGKTKAHNIFFLQDNFVKGIPPLMGGSFFHNESLFAVIFSSTSKHFFQIITVELQVYDDLTHLYWGR